MPPRETTSLLPSSDEERGSGKVCETPPPSSLAWLHQPLQHLSFGAGGGTEDKDEQQRSGRPCGRPKKPWVLPLLVLGVAVVGLARWVCDTEETPTYQHETRHGNVTLRPYALVERQAGPHFFEHYRFYEGADSLGSAGFQTYVGESMSRTLGLVDDDEPDGAVVIQSVPGTAETAAVANQTQKTLVATAVTSNGTVPRASVRLEGKQRFAQDTGGLFVLDLQHMPAGVCGVWPAFWLTDDDKGMWPAHGEIDVVEGVNFQTKAKTAMHTSAECNMYPHVSTTFDMTGDWDRATGIPDTWTGAPDNTTNVPADNCWVMAPHRWANQGCVAVHSSDDTIGEPLNKGGGGIYALEWDPAAGYIKSWVFPRKRHGDEHIPDNLLDSITDQRHLLPDPSTWGLPYAYFAIGEGTGCSASHFDRLRLVLNLAFCGTVAGNRFFTDCPASITQKFNVSGDPIASCNAYIASNPPEIQEAYWKIKSVSVFQRK